MSNSCEEVSSKDGKTRAPGSAAPRWGRRRKRVTGAAKIIRVPAVFPTAYIFATELDWSLDGGRLHGGRLHAGRGCGPRASAERDTCLLYALTVGALSCFPRWRT